MTAHPLQVNKFSALELGYAPQEEDEKPMPPVKLRIKMGRGRKPKNAPDAEASAPSLAAVSRPVPR